MSEFPGATLRWRLALSILAVSALMWSPRPAPAAHRPLPGPGTEAVPSAAGQQMADVEIETVPVARGVYMLIGEGGNIGVSVGEDGVILVDDQYAPLTDRIRAAVAEITDQPIRFLINTHWHQDHTGGNENFGEAGTLIFAHENVRERMSTEQFMERLDRTVPASPEAALPVVTFTEEVALHLNGGIRVFHVDPAHTDGDSVIEFQAANAVHMGDTFFAGRYPFVDLSSGGSVQGMIDAANRVLGEITPETRIIPGHGPLSGFDDLVQYRNVLTAARARVLEHVRGGDSLQETLAAGPTAEWDEAWGAGFIDGETFVSIIYESLTTQR